LGSGTLRALGSLLLVSFLLLLVFLVMPVLAPRAFGALPILFAAAAGWIAFANLLLVYPTHRFRLPSLLVIALLLAGVFSVWNDNHQLRQAPDPVVDWQRPAASTHFQAWLAERMSAGGEAVLPGEPYPVFVMAAAGGGIRAAYWTALVLGQLADRHPRFSDHLYALSGVSGGSLGSAVFTALVAERSATGGAAPVASYAESARAILAQDFLSPVVAGMLYPDLLQRFWPVPESIPLLGFLALPDRAKYLEASWEVAWRQQVGNQRFADDFARLWQVPGGGTRVPALLLNATWVDDGRRAVASNLRLSGPHFLEMDDLLSRCPLSLPLSTAVHLGARRTYVSPAGTVYCGGRARRLVDGGYFESSAAVTALELLQSILAGCIPDPNAVPNVWSCPGGRVLPVPLLISTDGARGSTPPATEDLRERFRRELALEARAPIRALLNSRLARGEHAEAQLKQRFPTTIDIRLTAMPEQRDSPLGWLLSVGSRQFMDQQSAHGAWLATIDKLLKSSAVAESTSASSPQRGSPGPGG